VISTNASHVFAGTVKAVQLATIIVASATADVA
jgi:hypothetical protein